MMSRGEELAQRWLDTIVKRKTVPSAYKDGVESIQPLAPVWSYARLVEALREALGGFNNPAVYEPRFTLPAVGLTVSPLLKTESARRAILFWRTGVNPVVVWGNSSVSATNGLTVPNSGTPLILTYTDLGGAITGEWFAIASGGAGSLAVIENLYYPQRGKLPWPAKAV